MSYQLKIEQKPGFLHAVATGRNTRENVQRYLQDVLRECLARGGTTLPAIAYVDVNAQGPLMKFAEDVAVNRGVRVRVFGTVAEAERWLRQLS
jgi:hypothetical protein